MEDGATNHPPKVDIAITADQHRAVRRAIQVLVLAENLFVRGGGLCYVQPESGALGEAAAKLVIRPVPPAHLSELLSVHGRCLRGEKEVPPPRWLPEMILARGSWPFRRLLAVVTAPVMLLDGNVLQTPGYDSQSGLLYVPNGEFPPVPQNPSREDALAALERLVEVVCDFVFASAADRSVWLAVLLGYFARALVRGPLPLVVFHAKQPAVGKSRLADAISLIAEGRPMARMAYTAADDEVRKRITSLALAGPRLVLLDNVVGAVGSAALDAALTAEEWTDRLLGSTRQLSLRLDIQWLLSGNNLEIVGDTGRRTLVVNLLASQEHPEQRTGFLHPDLQAWILRERPSLVCDALTVIRAYCAAGMPVSSMPNWGSYEAWSRVVRGMLLWLGQPDPLACACLASDPPRDLLLSRDLIIAVEQLAPAGGILASQLAHQIQVNHGDFGGLLEALSEANCLAADGTIKVTALSAQLRRMRGHVIGGRVLEHTPRRTSSAVRWLVRQAGYSGGSADGADGAVRDGAPPLLPGRPGGSAP